MKSGLHHWNHQRFSAIILITLMPWMIFTLCDHGGDFDVLRDTFSHVGPTFLLLMFMITALYHGVLGLETVIEDYVPNKSLRYTMISALQILFLLMGIFCGICIFKLLSAGV